MNGSPARPAVQIRRAEGPDGVGIRTVVEAAYRGTGGAVGWTTEAHLIEGPRTSAADVDRLLQDPSVRVLVAETLVAPLGACLVGCCYVHLSGEGAGPGIAEFGLFAVDPGAQGGGIGRSLLDAAVDAARTSGARELEITVLQSRPELRAWYERRGFVATGEVRPFPGRDQRLLVPGLGMDVLVITLET